MKRSIACVAVVFLTASAADAQNASDLLASGTAKAQSGDFAGAIVDYTKALELKPDYVEAYGERGLARIITGDLDGAIADYSKGIELDPTWAGAYQARGSAKRHKGDYNGAIADFDKGLTLRPDDSGTYNVRGLAKREKGDTDGAMADFTSAIRLNPKFADAYKNRSGIKREKDDLEGAIADASKAIEIDSSMAAAYLARGMALYYKGDADGARIEYNKALVLDPTDPAAYGTRGHLHFDQQDWRAALADYRLEEKLAPSFEYVRYRVWIVRMRLGEQSEANKELKDYLITRKGKPADWAGKIGDFLAGQVTEADFLKAAGNAGKEKDAEQHCEAYFYAGEKRLMEGDKVTARDLLEKCVATDVKDFTEYRSAMAELKALKAAK